MSILEKIFNLICEYFKYKIFFNFKDIYWLISRIGSYFKYTGIDVSGRAAETLEMVKRYVRRVFLNCLFSKDSLSHSFFIKILSDLM